MFAKMNQKVIFISGNFNEDLLNPSKHEMTDEFIDEFISNDHWTESNNITLCHSDRYYIYTYNGRKYSERANDE